MFVDFRCWMSACRRESARKDQRHTSKGAIRRREMWRSSAAHRRQLSGRREVAHRSLPEFPPPMDVARKYLLNEIAETSRTSSPGASGAVGGLPSASVDSVVTQSLGAISKTSSKLSKSAVKPSVLSDERVQIPLKRLSESKEAQESRRAVAELEQVLQGSTSPRAGSKVDELRTKQRDEIQRRKKGHLCREDFVSPRPSTLATWVVPARLSTDFEPGPPSRSPKVTSSSQRRSRSPPSQRPAVSSSYQRPSNPPASQRRSDDRASLPIIRHGRMFGRLDVIPTDRELDAPRNACHNCWEKGHRLSQCPQDIRSFCWNCGRRGVVLSSCPRCAKVHKRDMMRQFGEAEYEDHRRRRADYYEDRHQVQRQYERD
ncbi:serine/arginine repetitive matrix protein 2-like [Leptopilina boulardi]|uniref:serine/arginine repetitive matrix protein 2-like n=1 Tax=Leptopilina boulardi TaxID=63433 RepID=UPI0021F670A4|nr:serine/arginine repetitive matrix protein 2-like [Leptopilina boulardi]